MTNIKEETNLYTTSSHLENMAEGDGRDIPSVRDLKSTESEEDPNNPQVDSLEIRA